MTFLLELREAAKADHDENRRAALRAHADAIELLVDLLATGPTHEGMIALNGVWVRAAHLLTESEKHGSGPPATGGPGLQEGARLAA